MQPLGGILPGSSAIGSSRRSSSGSKSDWDAMLDEGNDSGYGEVLHSGSFDSTSSSSPPLKSIPDHSISGQGSEGLSTTGRLARSCAVEKKVISGSGSGMGGDLRSFFGRISPSRKRTNSSGEEGDSEKPEKRKKDKSSLVRKGSNILSSSRSNSLSGSSSSPGPSTLRSQSPLSSHPPKSSTKPITTSIKLEQLYLDPFSTPGHSTLSCNECSMSYMRTPIDIELHKKHHKKVVGGCDWIGMGATGKGGDEGKGILLLEEGIEWGGKAGGKILMVEANVEGLAGKRVSVQRDCSCDILTASYCRSKTFSPPSTQSFPRPLLLPHNSPLVNSFSL